MATTINAGDIGFGDTGADSWQLCKVIGTKPGGPKAGSRQLITVALASGNRSLDVVEFHALSADEG